MLPVFPFYRLYRLHFLGDLYPIDDLRNSFPRKPHTMFIAAALSSASGAAALFIDGNIASTISPPLNRHRRETYGRHRRRTATSPAQDRFSDAHAHADLDRALGQPFPSAGVADAVSIFEAAARRRLYRARLRAHRVRRRLRRDPAAARLHRRSYGRARDPLARARHRRTRVDPARPASELLVAGRVCRAARRCQQRLSSGRLCDPVGAYGRSADGPRLFHPHLCRLSRRRGGARDHGGAGDLGRRLRRIDQCGRNRRRGRAAAPDRRHSRCRCETRAGRGRRGKSRRRAC